MLMVGLTGGIGAGKSAVATRLAGLGAVVIDADRLARDVVAPGTDGLREVVAAFGTQVLTPDGALDRPAVAATVFGDDAARRRLEGIVHPRVRARSAELVAAAAPDAVVVNDVPLLVEAGLAATFHLVVVVEAAVEVRVGRLVRDRGMTVEHAQARIRAQAGDDRRRAAADVVLVNDGTPEELADRVDRLWAARLVPYEANLRRQRPVCPQGRVRLAEPDPTWPGQARRLIDRIAHALGPGGYRVDHIGSTAVPGLPARDVIDLQVGVVGAADGLGPRLAAAGFPGVPIGSGAGVGAGEPGRTQLPGGADPQLYGGADPQLPGGPDPQLPGGAGPQLYGSADPQRPVELRVRVTGSPGWRRALLIRDHLRADPARRAAYAEAKRRWAADDRYAGAKAAWAEQEYAAAESWAVATGWQP